MRFLKTTLLPIVMTLGLLFGSAGNVLAEDKPTITVGSKSFTENIVLAEALALLLEDAGFTVNKQLSLAGTVVLHEGLLSGDIDTYVEYTGTGLLAILGQDLPEAADMADADATPDAGMDQVYDIVAREYPEEFGVEWLEPFGLNNTYAIAVKGDVAEELGLEKISDLADHAGNMTLGTDQEFPIRPDGLPGFEEAYGFGFSDAKAGDIGLMYGAIDKGDVDVITSYATDGRIPSLGLVLLEDDMGFFPPYHAAPVIRQELLEEHPEIADILNQLAGQITNDDMAAINYTVDEEGVEPRDAARKLLEDKGLLDAND